MVIFTFDLSLIFIYHFIKNIIFISWSRGSIVQVTCKRDPGMCGKRLRYIEAMLKMNMFYLYVLHYFF